MADIVKVDDKTVRLEVKKQDEKFEVLLNGESKQVTVVDHDGRRMTLIIDNRPFDVIFAGENAVIVNNQEYSVDIYDEQVAKLIKTGAVKSQKQDLVVKAAMPGLIIEVSVKEGEQVKEGQGLLIIEAMKMQNEMQSTRDGVVKKIDIKKGQTVNSGDSLIIIE